MFMSRDLEQIQQRRMMFIDGLIRRSIGNYYLHKLDWQNTANDVWFCIMPGCYIRFVLEKSIWVPDAEACYYTTDDYGALVANRSRWTNATIVEDI
jgi:hypothetical protein